MQNPINMINIYNHQQADQSLVQTQQQNPIQIPVQIINWMNIISIFSNPQCLTLWKIYLPQSLLEDVVRWYHFTLCHAGVQKIYDTMSSRLWDPELYAACNQFWCPENCKKWKQPGQGYRHLLPWNAIGAPCDEVAVDLVRPWKIECQNRWFEFNTLKCIDSVKNLVEIIWIDHRTANHVGEQFENMWH